METIAEQWARAEPVVLPWQGEETGWTLREMAHGCPRCGDRMVEPRGRIYESLGVVEIHLAERCPRCGLVEECRERLCPKEGVLMRLVEGQWRRFQLTRRESRGREALKSAARTVVFRVLPGYGLGTLLGVVSGVLTAVMSVAWVVGLVVIVVMVYALAYWEEGRNE